MGKIPFDLSESSAPRGDRVKTEWFKFREGDNIIRVLSEDPVCGMQLWIDHPKLKNGFPKNIRQGQSFSPEDLSKARLNDKGERAYPQEFIGVLVWDYSLSKIFPMQISARSLLIPIQKLENRLGWINQYDLVVTYTRNAKPPYTVVPDPKSPLNAQQIQALRENTIDMESILFRDDRSYGHAVSEFGDHNTPAQPRQQADDTTIDDVPF